MADREGTESEVRRLIEEFVQQHWSRTQTVCYLSSIGVHLNQTAPENRIFLSKGLGDFLRQNPVVRVVQFPGVEQKIGAVPLSVSIPDNVVELFSRNRLTTGSQHRNVYLQEFWNAFIRPIENFPRFVLIDDSNRITVRDDTVEIESSKAYEILPQDLTVSVPDGSIADKVSATHSAIDTWLEKHSLDPAIFLRPTIRRHGITTGSNLEKFLSAFEGLSTDDLARIEVPLDILVKLISRK